MFYFYTNVLKFNPQFLSVLRALNSISMVAGIMIYYAFFKKVLITYKDGPQETARPRLTALYGVRPHTTITDHQTERPPGNPRQTVHHHR